VQLVSQATQFVIRAGSDDMRLGGIGASGVFGTGAPRWLRRSGLSLRQAAGGNGAAAQQQERARNQGDGRKPGARKRSGGSPSKRVTALALQAADRWVAV